MSAMQQRAKSWAASSSFFRQNNCHLIAQTGDGSQHRSAGPKQCASPNASGPNRREVMGDASTVTVSAIVVPPASVKTLSANVAVPFSISGTAVYRFFRRVVQHGFSVSESNTYINSQLLSLFFEFEFRLRTVNFYEVDRLSSCTVQQT